MGFCDVGESMPSSVLIHCKGRMCYVSRVERDYQLVSQKVKRHAAMPPSKQSRRDGQLQASHNTHSWDQVRLPSSFLASLPSLSVVKETHAYVYTG